MSSDDVYSRPVTGALIPAWFWLLAVLWTIGAGGGTWYIAERIADA